MKITNKNKTFTLLYLFNFISLNIAAVNTLDEEITCKKNTEINYMEQSVNSGIDSTIINEKERSIIEKYMSFMAKCIDKSCSGNTHKIKRKDKIEYTFDSNNKAEIDNYNSIFELMDKGHYEEAYKIVFDNKMADCYEQSFYIGMMLKDNQQIDDKFILFILNLVWEEDDKDASHVFLIMFPRGTNLMIKNKKVDLNSIIYYNSAYQEKNLPQSLTKELESLSISQLLFNQRMIIIDTWQQRIFEAGSINLNNNPITYSNIMAKIKDEFDFNLEIIYFILHNMDIAYYGFKNFKEFHGKIYDSHDKI